MASLIKYDLKTGKVVPRSYETRKESDSENFDLKPEPVPESNISHENNSDHEGNQKNLDLKIDFNYDKG